MFLGVVMLPSFLTENPNARDPADQSAQLAADNPDPLAASERFSRFESCLGLINAVAPP